MRDTFVCDICKSRIAETSWEDNAHDLQIRIYTSSNNPLGELGAGYQDADIYRREVCDHCRKELAKSIADALLRLNPKFKAKA